MRLFGKKKAAPVFDPVEDRARAMLRTIELIVVAAHNRKRHEGAREILNAKLDQIVGAIDGLRKLVADEAPH